MKKSRMAIDDIAAMVGSIRKNVVNMRVTNIYDTHATSNTSNKTYILKLHQPPFPKVFLLLESGVRFHTSQYARDASPSSSALPSQFTMKLRKHLRGKRLVDLRQLEGDRVIDFTFGWESLQCHLILELYASGNIILTDENYTILSLLRTHRFDENVKMAVKQVYPIHVLENSGDASRHKITSASQLQDFVTAFFDQAQQQQAHATAKTKKSQKPLNLKQLLLTKESGFGGLGPTIVEHCIVSAQLTASTKIKSAAEFAKLFTPQQLDALVQELVHGWKLLERLQTDQVALSSEAPPVAETTAANSDGAVSDAGESRGFITLRDAESNQYEEFTPFLYAQHADKPHRAFKTFDQAVDEYFSHYETQQAQIDRQNALNAAENKLAKLKKNQMQQLEQLHQVQQSSAAQARLIEKNQQDVENVLLVLRSALASGMDWKGLEELVRFEQKNGNPVASLIHELDLAKNRAAILLCDDDDDEEEEDDDKGVGEEDKQAHVIWIDLSLSALANARELYSKKKKAVEKVKKATKATEKAIQQAEKKTKQTLHKQQMKKHVIYQRRKTLWFEKFYWFLSNENYLVVGGKDAHQNELLVKRYLRKGDVFVHADLHGAPTCIVRNRFNDAKTPIPIATLEQAGCMAVCRSSAWSSQVISGAYWVHADQVSKTAPSGEYLTTGSFMVRGKKNYIQPSRLEMGLGMVFRVDESCIANHQTPNDVLLNATKESKGAEESVEDDSHEQMDSQPPMTTPSEADLADVDAAPDASADHATKAEEEQTASADGEEESKEEDPEEEEDDDQEEKSTTREGKVRISAKQRRDLRKQKNKVHFEEPAMPPPAPSQSKKKSASGASSAAEKPKNVRGKKGKLKKMKKKYADQDDEDRRLRMEALGHALDLEESSKHEQVTQDAPHNDQDAKDQEGDDEDQQENVASGGGQVTEEFIRAQREKKEKFLEQEEEEVESADFFDAFTGAPVANDLLLYAMPMCAPYAALHRFKYKVKLVPGNQKKGKAAKQALEHFFASSLKPDPKAKASRGKPKPEEVAAATAEQEEVDVDPLATQRELMKCIPDNELVNCMVGPVKLSAPGLHGTTNTTGGKKKKPKKH